MSEEATVGKELIAGMEQVILHIQHQESSIQELKKTFEETQEKALEIDTKNKELETANKFLSNIVEAQTKKIEELANQLRLERFTKDNDVQIKKIVELEEENKQLKEKNEKWEYWASEVIHWSHSASKDNLQAKKLITPDNKPTIGDVRDFGEEIKQLKETCDNLNDTAMGNAHDYEVLSEKMANDSETFVGVISDLESQVKSLESENNNLQCVLSHKGVNKKEYEKILHYLDDQCKPDEWDCM